MRGRGAAQAGVGGGHVAHRRGCRARAAQSITQPATVVPSAAAMKPMKRREAERDGGVDEHRVDGEAERGAGVLAGVVERRDHLLHARRPAGRRRRPPRRARSAQVSAAVKAPRWKSTETIGTGITISATRGGQGERERELGGAVDRVAAARAVAGLEAAREVGQEHDADGDADHAERQLVEPVGVGEPGDGAVEERADLAADEQVDLHHAAGEERRAP